MQFSKKVAMAGLFVMAVSAQAYDSETKVDTNNTSTSTSTVTSTNTNNNTNNNINDTTVNSTATNNNNNVNTSTSTNTNNNNNVNTTTSTNTNNNNNVNTSTSTNVNTNNNINSGEQTFNNNNVNTSTVTSTNNNTNVNTSTSENVNRNINSGEQTFNNNNNVNSTSNNTTTSTSTNKNENVNRNINETKVEQPPPTAIAPSMMSGGNNDLCTTGTSGAVQTQILGVSSGGTVRDLNCERLKNAKTLYDMGMKVAAVATLCQDRRVFDAMWNAGTPCPFEGMIGEAAKLAWEAHPERVPKAEEPQTDDFYKKTTFGAVLGALLFGIF